MSKESKEAIVNSKKEKKTRELKRKVRDYKKFLKRNETHIELNGYLEQDPLKTYTEGGKLRCVFWISVDIFNSEFKAIGKNTFFCVCSSDETSNASKSLVKGEYVDVVGVPRIKKYVNRNGIYCSELIIFPTEITKTDMHRDYLLPRDTYNQDDIEEDFGMEKIDTPF